MKKIFYLKIFFFFLSTNLILFRSINDIVPIKKKKRNWNDEDEDNGKNERGRVVAVDAIRKDTSPAINTRKL